MGERRASTTSAFSSACEQQPVVRYAIWSYLASSRRAALQDAHRSGCPINLTLEVLGDRYSLTEPAIQLVPMLAAMGAWGRRHAPVSKELSIRAQLLEEGGPELWEELMAELRASHLGAPASSPSVLNRLQAAYEATLASAD